MPILRSKLTLGAASLFLVMFSVLLYRAYLKKQAVEGDMRRLEENITRAEEKNRELSRLLAYFSDPQHLENEAKLRLNLKKPGENVLIVPPESTPSPTPSSTPEPERPAFTMAAIAEFFKSMFSKKVVEIK